MNELQIFEKGCNVKNLVMVTNNQVVVSSRDVADNFGKRHDHILRDIENVLKGIPKIGETPGMFLKHSYVNQQNGQTYPEYLMNRDGFSLLVMGFTGQRALEWKLKYINAFNEMEMQLKNKLPDFSNPVIAARAWADEYEKRQIAESENKSLLLENAQQAQVIGELKPKADYTDLILKNKSLMPITAIAKDYGMSGKAFNKLLHEKKIQYKIGDQWFLYAELQAKGYTHSKTFDFNHANGRPDVNVQTQWTQKGRLFLYNTLKQAGIVPVIEQDEDA